MTVSKTSWFTPFPPLPRSLATIYRTPYRELHDFLSPRYYSAGDWSAFQAVFLGAGLSACGRYATASRPICGGAPPQIRPFAARYVLGRRRPARIRGRRGMCKLATQLLIINRALLRIISHLVVRFSIFYCIAQLCHRYLAVYRDAVKITVHEVCYALRLPEIEGIGFNNFCSL